MDIFSVRLVEYNMPLTKKTIRIQLKELILELFLKKAHHMEANFTFGFILY